MLIYHRDTQTYHEEVEYKGKTLDFLYNTMVGRILLKLVVARPWFSRLRANYQKSPISQKDIKPFVKKYNIQAATGNYESFNDFFIRQKKYHTNTNTNELIAVADGKLSVYKISDHLMLHIKNSEYTLADLVNNAIDLSEFKNGTCLIFRLAVDDYHRYVFFDNGVVEKQFFINGMLHTIRPIANKYKVYSQNCREVSVLNTQNFGQAIQIEVGAMLVGKINNHATSSFRKMDEKGYFEFGGSTIVLLLKDNVKIDADIVNETQVFIGERIGIKCLKD